MIGTVGSDEKAELARAHGCDHPIVYTRDDFVAEVERITGGAKLPVVYDSIGRDTFLKSLDCLRPRGLMVSFGNASGPVDPFPPGILAQKGSLFLTRPTMYHYTATRAELEAAANELFALVENGTIRIEVNQRFPLRDAAEAHRALEARETTGSTVFDRLNGLPFRVQGDSLGPPRVRGTMRKLIVIGSLALAAVGAPAWSEDAGTTRPPTIPVSRFAALPDMYRPLLSPDGHRIAARKTADGSTTLVIIDADNPTARARGLPIGKWPVASLKWAGNQRLLLTVQSTFDINGYEFPFRRLIAIDVDTGTSRIADRKSRGMYAGDVLYTDPTGSWALVAGQDTAQSYPSVKRVDLATGDATVVERSRPDVWDWYADENGVVRAGISYDGPRWTIWYRDKAGEKLRPIRGKFPKDDDSTVDRFIFRGDHSWVVTNERTGRFGSTNMI